MAKPRKIDEFKTLGLINSLNTFPVLLARYKELVSNGWSVYVVEQNRGMCVPSGKYITVPVWAIEPTRSKGLGYWVYYLAHEMAHTDTYDNHGPKFQARFRELCPIEFQHYELGYKIRQATSAGITMEHASKAYKIDVIDILDLL